MARDLVPRVLEERDARVEVVVAYQTVLPAIASEEVTRLLTPPPDAVTFTSSSTANHFVQLAGAERAAEILRSVVVASIGPVTSATLRQLGIDVTIEARESTMAGLAKALGEHLRPK